MLPIIRIIDPMPKSHAKQFVTQRVNLVNLLKWLTGRELFGKIMRQLEDQESRGHRDGPDGHDLQVLVIVYVPSWSLVIPGDS